MPERRPATIDVAAYHCQQAAEKLLKGFLVQANSHVRRTHDLDALAAIVMVHFPSIEHLLKPMRDWTSWSVAYRYPGEAGPEPEPAVVELSEALEVITHLDTALRELAPRNADGA